MAIIVAETLVFLPSKTEEIISERAVSLSPQASLSIQGFHAVHLNQQGQKEIIEADEAEFFKKLGYAILRKVKARIYAKGDDAIRIQGIEGKYYMETKDLELFKDVNVISESQGYQLKTDYLRYEERNNLIWSYDKLWLAGPNPEKPSLTLRGKGFKADTKTEEFEVLEDVHCQKFDEKADGIEIDSAKARAFLGKHEILFMENVVVKQKDMNIFTDNFWITYNDQNQAIDKAKAFNTVKIIQGDRIATCENAFLLNREQKMVLRGHPKVTQGNDVVEGKIIIFFTAQNKILFDEAIGEVEAKRAKEMN